MFIDTDNFSFTPLNGFCLVWAASMRKKWLLHWKRNHPHSLQSAKKPNPFSFFVGYSQINPALLSPGGGSVFPLPALRNLQHCNSSQKISKKAVIFSILHAEGKLQLLLVLCVQFLTWPTVLFKLHRLLNPSAQKLCPLQHSLTSHLFHSSLLNVDSKSLSGNHRNC